MSGVCPTCGREWPPDRLAASAAASPLTADPLPFPTDAPLAAAGSVTASAHVGLGAAIHPAHWSAAAPATGGGGSAAGPGLRGGVLPAMGPPDPGLPTPGAGAADRDPRPAAVPELILKVH